MMACMAPRPPRRRAANKLKSAERHGDAAADADGDEADQAEHELQALEALDRRATSRRMSAWSPSSPSRAASSCTTAAVDPTGGAPGANVYLRLAWRMRRLEATKTFQTAIMVVI